jgi:hypothetical protein
MGVFMLIIIRIHSKGPLQPVWDRIVEQQESIQKAFPDKCQLLYLTKRMGFNREASLFVDVADESTLGYLVVSHLAKIKGVDNFVIHHFSNPSSTHCLVIPRNTSVLSSTSRLKLRI